MADYTNFDYTGPGQQGTIDKGYAVKFPNIDPRKNYPTGYLECVLNSKHTRLYFWATEMDFSFSMGGSYAQTVEMRRWYPRNFVAPVVNVSGIMPNQFQYNRLAAFIRQCHIQFLQANGTINQMRMILPAGGYDIPTGRQHGRLPAETRRHIRLANSHVTTDQATEEAPWHGGQKGSRSGYDLIGYIGNIRAGGQKFNFIPTFNFQFTISRSQGGVLATDSTGDTWTAFTGSGPADKADPGAFTQNPSLPQKARPKVKRPGNRNKQH